MSFKKDFSWQSGFYPDIKKILIDNASKLVKAEVSNPEQDMKQATDFVINVKGGDVAVRIRRDIPYRDLTIRSKRANGSDTELKKIKDGFGDFYLYLWTSSNEVVEWWLVDIGKMREAGLFDEPKTERWNPGKESAFVCFRRQEIEKADALIASAVKEKEHA